MNLKEAACLGCFDLTINIPLRDLRIFHIHIRCIPELCIFSKIIKVFKYLLWFFVRELSIAHWSTNSHFLLQSFVENANDTPIPIAMIWESIEQVIKPLLILIKDFEFLLRKVHPSLQCIGSMYENFLKEKIIQFAFLDMFLEA